MRFVHLKKALWLVPAALLLLNFSVSAQTVNIDASTLLAHVDVSLSPRAGSFVEGSTFDVPILLNTKGRSVNGIQIRVSFDKDKLSIVNPTGGKSIIGVWVEPPGFDNSKGIASFIGVVPDGITTDAGVVGIMTFKVKSAGKAVVSISSDSKILMNDGLGTEANVTLGRASYDLLPKAPEGVKIYSDTDPLQDAWYNDNNVVLAWDKDPGVTGFSYVMDNKPGTIPDDMVNTQDTSRAFDNLADGLWYFHIKAQKGSVWGTAGQYLVRIDTTPPATFKPEADYLVASILSSNRTLLSFSTTDNLSGVDHYEVGVIDKSQPLTVSPEFVQSDSPYQVPAAGNGNLQVIVRAVDRAGNIRDSSIDVHTPFAVTAFIQDYLVYILLAIILIGLTMLMAHYIFGHHILRYFRRVAKEMKDEEYAGARNSDE